jgi:hypothetical protein
LNGDIVYKVSIITSGFTPSFRSFLKEVGNKMAKLIVEENENESLLKWECPKCQKQSDVNMEHALVASGVWKPGATQKQMCWGCRKNTVHTIVSK